MKPSTFVMHRHERDGRKLTTPDVMLVHLDINGRVTYGDTDGLACAVERFRGGHGVVRVLASLDSAGYRLVDVQVAP